MLKILARILAFILDHGVKKIKLSMAEAALF
jgi:hypothetical protein